MGREIRMVPPDWEHPKYTKDNAKYTNWIGSYIGMYDQDYDSACAEWYEGVKNFKPSEYCKWFHEYKGNPPNPESYRSRKWTNEEATHYQVYETVSEGTPVTPHFATKEELVEYLVEHGDFWDQEQGNGGWKRENAEGFVGRGFAMSMIVTVNENGAEIKMARDQ